MNVNDIKVVELDKIPVRGGDVYHAMKAGDVGFQGFGEVYFSFVDMGIIKGWKRHLKMHLNLVAPVGSVKFIFLDDYGNTREEVIGKNRYARLFIPPGIWFAFKGMEPLLNLVMNLADMPHDPDEVERLELDKFLVNWS